MCIRDSYGTVSHERCLLYHSMFFKCCQDPVDRGYSIICLLYTSNIAMTLVIRFLNQMDTEGINVAARSYTAQITNLSFCEMCIRDRV